MVHALIIQVCGRKQWYLSTEANVERLVRESCIPKSVVEEGNTHNFAVEGKQSEVFKSFDGFQSVLLEEGDAMLLPAGLYHDVEAQTTGALSITIRFELPTSCVKEGCIRPKGHWGQHIQSVDKGQVDEGPPTPKSLFDRWRNAVKEEGDNNVEEPRNSGVPGGIEHDEVGKQQIASLPNKDDLDIDD